MKHITKRYGGPANLLKMQTEDFSQLQDFLRKVGADIRMISEYAGSCIVQIRNDGLPWEPWDADKMGVRE